MEKKKEIKKEKNEEKDDEQKNLSCYGEFVPSYFSWITQEQQRRKAEKLGSITEGKKEIEEKYRKT